MLNLKDSLLTQTGALPAAASSSTTTTSLDLGLNSIDAEAVFERVEFELDAPALTTVQLPNTDQITYDVIVSASSNLASPVAVYPAILTQTGAGGAGAPAATRRFKLPQNLNALLAGARYLGIRANTGVGSVPGAGVNFTLTANF